MILSKAPLRVSLFGGTSDIYEHYEREPGATISLAIDKYVYVAVMHTPHDHVKVSYSEQEKVANTRELKNDLIRETLLYFGIDKNIEITTFADIPTGGTGLGGSSAFTCALIRALERHTGKLYNEYDVADIACHIEIERCGRKIGRQDQYASAFGGLNFVEYFKDHCLVTKLDDGAKHFSKGILVPILKERDTDAHTIIDSIDFEINFDSISELAGIARDMKQHVPTVMKWGQALDQSWLIKKSISPMISTPDIDMTYDKCKEAGAVGCKLLGAGGGGYMFPVISIIESIRKAFPERKCLDFRLASDGARVVYED